MGLKKMSSKALSYFISQLDTVYCSVVSVLAWARFMGAATGSKLPFLTQVKSFDTI